MSTKVEMIFRFNKFCSTNQSHAHLTMRNEKLIHKLYNMLKHNAIHVFFVVVVVLLNVV